MKSVTIADLDDDVLDRVAEQARARNHTVEAELRDIVTRAVRPLSIDELFERAAKIALTTRGHAQTDSGVLQREDRER